MIYFVSSKDGQRTPIRSTPRRVGRGRGNEDPHMTAMTRTLDTKTGAPRRERQRPIRMCAIEPAIIPCICIMLRADSVIISSRHNNYNDVNLFLCLSLNRNSQHACRIRVSACMTTTSETALVAHPHVFVHNPRGRSTRRARCRAAPLAPSCPAV